MERKPDLRDASARWTDRAAATHDAAAFAARENARALRSSMPLPEVLLWQRLRGERVLGLKFRRQHVIGPYTADFYCHALRLAVEVDGQHHAQRRDEDRARDAYFLEQGVSTLRLPAALVLSDTDAAVREVEKKALALNPRPAGP